MKTGSAALVSEHPQSLFSLKSIGKALQIKDFAKRNRTPIVIRIVSKLVSSYGGPEETRTLDLSDANRTLSQLSYRPLSLVILSQQISPVNSFLSGKGASRFQDAPFSFTLRQDRSKLQFQSRRYEREPRPPRHIGKSCRHRDVRYTVRSWQPQLRMQAAR